MRFAGLSRRKLGCPNDSGQGRQPRFARGRGTSGGRTKTGLHCPEGWLASGIPVPSGLACTLFGRLRDRVAGLGPDCVRPAKEPSQGTSVSIAGNLISERRFGQLTLFSS